MYFRRNLHRFYALVAKPLYQIGFVFSDCYGLYATTVRWLRAPLFLAQLIWCFYRESWFSIIASLLSSSLEWAVSNISIYHASYYGLCATWYWYVD